MDSATQPSDASAARPRRPRRDTVRRRGEILAAARQVFIQRGLAGARTKEIALAAGVTEAVLYRYFPSKEDLFQAAVVDPLEEFFEQLLPMEALAIDAAPTIEEREELARRAELQWLEAMDEIVPLLGVALFSDRENGVRFYRERLYPLITRGVESAARSTASWARPGLDTTVLLLTIFGVNLAVALDRHFRGGGEDLDALAPRILDQILYGVSAYPPEVGGTRTRRSL